MITSLLSNSACAKKIFSIAILSAIALTSSLFAKPVLADDIKVHNYYTSPPFEEIKELYPDYETSLLLPGLIEINIEGVAEELLNQG